MNVVAIIIIVVLVVAFLLLAVALLLKYIRYLNGQSMAHLHAKLEDGEKKRLEETLSAIKAQGREVSQDTQEKIKLLTQSQKELTQEQHKSIEGRQQSLEGSFKSLSTDLRDQFSRTRDEIDKKLTEAMKNLGKFEQLSGHVETLSRMLSNVKEKGQFGERILGDIIADVIPDTYYRKEYTLANNTRVDFVIRLPEKKTPWLPIDSKYPQEAYGQLLRAREALDKLGEQKAREDLKKFIKKQAQDLQKKYICPPETTDFAILFIPQESTFYEIYKESQFIYDIKKTYNVMITGPYLFYALLQIISLGYNKLTIESNLEGILKGLRSLEKDVSDVAERLGKAEGKAGSLYEEIGRVHRKTDKMHKLTIELNSLEGVEAVLPEAVEEGGEELEVLSLQTPATEVYKEGAVLSADEKLEQYRDTESLF